MLEDISLKEFCSLSQKNQQEVLHEFAVCVGERNFSKYKILLYQVSSFYVEMKYDKRKRVNEEFVPFDSTDLLMPYLQDIDISPVL